MSVTTIPVHPAILVLSLLCLLTAVLAIGIAMGKDMGGHAAKEIIILSKTEMDKLFHEAEEERETRRISHGEMVQMETESKNKGNAEHDA